MRIIFSIFALVTMLIVMPSQVSAAESSELPLPTKYEFANDPLLLIWSLSTKKDEPVVTEKGELTADEKRLAYWNKKQAHLWANLETGKEFTINASAYTAAADECGKSDGITASGLMVTENRTLACPPAYPFGAKIAIEGMGVYRCEDRGGAIKGNKFDIYMETKTEAFTFGRQNLSAMVVD